MEPSATPLRCELHPPTIKTTMSITAYNIPRVQYEILAASLLFHPSVIVQGGLAFPITEDYISPEATVLLHNNCNHSISYKVQTIGLCLLKGAPCEGAVLPNTFQSFSFTSLAQHSNGYIPARVVLSVHESLPVAPSGVTKTVSLRAEHRPMQYILSRYKTNPLRSPGLVKKIGVKKMLCDCRGLIFVDSDGYKLNPFTANCTTESDCSQELG